MKVDSIDVIFKGVEFQVSGEYVHGVEPVYYYRDGSGDPGTSPEFHIAAIEFDGKDVTDLITLLFDENELIECCIDEVEKKELHIVDQYPEY